MLVDFFRRKLGDGNVPQPKLAGGGAEAQKETKH